MNRMQQRGRLTALFSLVAVLAALALGGCGEKDKSKVIVARVGDHEVTLDYFERKMNKFPEGQAPVDFLSREGREEFLETIVNKEVLAIKAEQLGMAADGQADNSAEALAELKAVQAMRADVVAPYQDPTENDILDYYENFARVLKVSYMLLDTAEEAEEARGLVVGGERWDTVAGRFNAGDPGPSGDWTLDMKYGTVADDLEEKVFKLPVGEVSEPIDSIYGFFVIRVDNQRMDRVAPLEEMRDKIRASVIKQNSALAIDRFRQKAFEDYDFVIDEDALRIVYDALPADVPLVDPPAKEDLAGLSLKPSDLDKVLMSYAGNEWTLRKYSDFYDESSVFGRPRRENRLGGLRRALKEICLRDLMPIVARDQGFMEAPDVRDEYKNRREQQMVTRLYDETIRGSVETTPAEVEEYWAQHKDEFIQPERRKARALVAASEADGLAAQLEAQSSSDWAQLVEKYCIDSTLKQEKGELPEFSPNSQGPIAEQVFRMNAVGDVSYPVELGPGQWLVCKLIEITEENRPTFEESKARVGQIVQSQKEELEFQKRVEEWKKDLDIETFPNRLMDAIYEPAAKPSDRVPVTVGNLDG